MNWNGSKGDGVANQREIHSVTDDGDDAAFRYDKWKISFLTQSGLGGGVWDSVCTAHRLPVLADRGADRLERAYGRGFAGTTAASLLADA